MGAMGSCNGVRVQWGQSTLIESKYSDPVQWGQSTLIESKYSDPIALNQSTLTPLHPDPIAPRVRKTGSGKREAKTLPLRFLPIGFHLFQSQLLEILFVFQRLSFHGMEAPLKLACCLTQGHIRVYIKMSGKVDAGK